MKTRTRVMLIGVGNICRRDDAVGLAVIGGLRSRAARHPLPPWVRLASCDGDPGRLMDMWENTELAVVVDAARARPGQAGWYTGWTWASRGWSRRREAVRTVSGSRKRLSFRVCWDGFRNDS